MRTNKLFWISSLSLSFALSTACSKDDDTNDSAAEGSSGTGTPGSDTDPQGTSNGASTGTPEATGSGSESEGGSEAGESSTGPAEPLPNGSSCSEDAECESGSCFNPIAALPGVCGECKTEDDCVDSTGHGCNLPVPAPISNPPMPAVCNDGSAGSGCQTDAVCLDGRVCALILSIGEGESEFQASTCSDCEMDADCDGGQLCSPRYDIPTLSGQKTCVMPGMVEDAQGCDYMGSGDSACASGHCVAVSVAGMVTLGVCNPCEADEDCAGEQTCMAPSATLTGFTPGGCMDPA